MSQPLVLCIVDGFGIDNQDPSNPIPQNMPWWTKTWQHSCHKTLLKASGPSVGLPEGQMGNSEVGHLTIGSGQIVQQDLIRIGQLVQTQFFQHPHIQNIIHDKTRVHLVGLFSKGGVHAHQEQFMSIFNQLHPHVPIFCHLITDGRDTSPSIFTKQYEAELEPYVATVMGRYYAMDRDKRWDRTQQAFDAIVHAKGHIFKDVITYVQTQPQTDEFIEPGVKEGYQGVHPKDAVMIVNFRADRILQILSLLSQAQTLNLTLLTLSDLPMTIPGVTTLFPKQPITHTLGEIIAHHGLKQLRVAETEKYAHVTYFFNGGKDVPYEGEARVLIPSPKVSTYDHAPHMSAEGVTDAVLKGMDAGYDVIIVNYANADMVGHTGQYNAVVQALQHLDVQLEKLYNVCIKQGYVLMITSDHGNVENMVDADHTPNTAHSTNPVPLLILNSLVPIDLSGVTQLSDIAGLIVSLIINKSA